MLNHQLNTNLGYAPMSNQTSRSKFNPLFRDRKYYIDSDGKIIEQTDVNDITSTKIHQSNKAGISFTGLLKVGSEYVALDSEGLVRIIDNPPFDQRPIILNANRATFMFSAFGTLFLGYELENNEVLIKALLSPDGKIYEAVTVKVRPVLANPSSDAKYENEGFKRNLGITEYVTGYRYYTPSFDFSPIIQESDINFFPTSLHFAWDRRNSSLVQRIKGLAQNMKERIKPTIRTINVDHFVPVLTLKLPDGVRTQDVLKTFANELPFQIQTAIAKALGQDPPQPSTAKPEEKSRSCFRLAR